MFVDPPFGQNIPYADLALLVESWHGVTTSVPEEAVVDSFKDKSIDTYGELMTACFTEFYRVLKPGRWMTVEFSNSSNEVWTVIQQALAAAGFVVADTRVLDKEQGSYRQVTATTAVKRDLIISCYKPAEHMTQTVVAAAGGADGVWAFVREHLRHLPTTDGRRGKAQVVREQQYYLAPFSVLLLHQDQPEASAGDHRHRDAQQVQFRRRRHLRFHKGSRYVGAGAARRFSRAKTLRSIRRAGWCRLFARSGATTSRREGTSRVTWEIVPVGEFLPAEGHP